MNYLENPLVKLLIAVLAVFLLFTAINSGITVYNNIASNRPEKDTLTISAIGEVDSNPDIARANVSVLTEGKDPKNIQDENAKKMNDISAYLKSQSVDEKDIKTENYNLYPQYNYSDGKQELDGYIITQSLSVKFRDLENVGALLAGVIDRGANTVNSLFFEIEHPEDLQQEARKQALENAKSKAQELANVAGVKLGKVKSFSESNVSYPQPYPTAYNSRDIAEGFGGAAPNVEPGSTKVSASVSVTFELK